MSRDVFVCSGMSIQMRFNRRKVANRRRRAANRRRGNRKSNIRTLSHTFTEVLALDSLPVNAGGVFYTTFSQIPQAASYAALYKQFCIKKLQVTLMPRLNSFDPNTAGGTGLSFWAPRIAYSIADTPSVMNPTSELDVLTDNGVKVVSLGNKPVKMTCYPKPSVAMIGADSNPVAVRQRKAVWFNQRNAEVANDGWSVPHGNIRYWISANPLLSDYQFDVYYKVTFAVRDPA